MPPDRGRHGLPVNPAVLIEAAVFAQDQRRTQRGRHLGERNPLAAPHGGIGTQALDHDAVTVEDQGVRRPEVALDLGEGRHGGSGRWLRQKRQQRPSREQRCKPQRTRQRPPCAVQGRASTLKLAWGNSPNISGAYIASTRVGGRAKRPTVFSRRVYCSLNLPLGR